MYLIEIKEIYLVFLLPGTLIVSGSPLIFLGHIYIYLCSFPLFCIVVCDNKSAELPTNIALTASTMVMGVNLVFIISFYLIMYLYPVTLCQKRLIYNNHLKLLTTLSLMDYIFKSTNGNGVMLTS